MEDRLGFAIFSRTTRTLSLTKAGTVFLDATAALPGILDQALRRVREDVLAEPKIIRIGISRSLSTAHLPGLFAAQRKEAPGVRISVTVVPGDLLIRQIAEAKLDLGVVTAPDEPMSDVRITHRMADRFALIAPRDHPKPIHPEAEEEFAHWAHRQQWIFPAADSTVRTFLETWLRTRGVEPTAMMEIDGFDLTVQLVALGMGVAFVPERSLRGLAPRQRVQILNGCWDRLVRQLVVIAPRYPSSPPHVVDFLGRILFS
jgi:DNA-binding transcriptional LysR family regulator